MKGRDFEAEKDTMLANCKDRPNVVVFRNLIASLTPEEEKEFDYENFSVDEHIRLCSYLRNDMPEFEKDINDRIDELKTLRQFRNKRLDFEARKAMPVDLVKRYSVLSMHWRLFVLGAVNKSQEDDEIFTEQKFCMMLGAMSRKSMKKEYHFEVLEVIDKAVCLAETGMID
jgi:hypothetical protein